MSNNTNPRLYKDANWLREQVIEHGKTSRDISREQKVSYRLIEIYLRDFEIPHVSMVPKSEDDA